jgi:hypothetical protein
MLLDRIQLGKNLFLILTAVSMLGAPGAQATNSVNNQTIRLDKAAYFSTLQGDSIQLKPGTYELAALPDSLQVIPQDRSSSFQFALTLHMHNQNLSEPIAVSVVGKPEGESADRHMLALFLPGGFIYEAEGTYSGIQSRAVNAQAVITDPEQIYLERPVHFYGPDGRDQVAKPGRYMVEQADSNIQLLPGEGQVPILLEAQEDTHDGGWNIPVALSLPGAAEEEADIHHVVLLLPNGKSLEAIGTYSGIQQRGLLGDAVKGVKKGVKKGTKTASKTVKRAKHTVSRVGRRVTSSPPSFGTFEGTAEDIGRFGKGTGRQLGSTARNTAQDAARFGKTAALEVKKGAEWTARQAAKGIKWLGEQACKVALKTAEVGIKVAGKSTSPLLKQVQKMLERQDMQRKLERLIGQVKRQLGPTINKAIEGTAIMTAPKNANVLKRLLKKETMCEKSPSEIQKTLLSMFKKPIKEVVTLYQRGSASQVRSRGAKDFSVAFGLGGGGGYGGGVDVGTRYTTSRFGHTSPPDQWFLDANASLATRAGGEGGVIIGFFPNMAPKDTGGSFFAISVGAEAVTGKVGSAQQISKGVGVSVDIIMGPLTDNFTFQGFAISFTAGASTKSLPVGGGALKVGYGLALGN